MEYDILSDMIILKIFSVSTLYGKEGVYKQRINRPHWAIIVKYEGKTTYFSNGQSYISDINHFLIIPKGLTYEFLCNKSGHFTVIEFECQKSYDNILSIQVSDGEKLLNIFHELEYKRIVKPPMYELDCMKEMYSILSKMCKKYSKNYIPPQKLIKLRPAVDYIAKNYHKNIKNEELAELTGLSTVYFRKLFTETFGTSPIAYICSLRIKKAKEMLKSDYSSITDIALSLGYPSLYSFSRAFKKHTGLSPSQYILSNDLTSNR